MRHLHRDQSERAEPDDGHAVAIAHVALRTQWNATYAGSAHKAKIGSRFPSR